MKATIIINLIMLLRSLLDLTHINSDFIQTERLLSTN